MKRKVPVEIQMTPAVAWTALAGALFIWNGYRYITQSGEFASELARQHPWISYGVWLGIGIHIFPRRKPVMATGGVKRALRKGSLRVVADQRIRSTLRAGRHRRPLSAPEDLADVDDAESEPLIARL